jgi:hypothetical protein
MILILRNANCFLSLSLSLSVLWSRYIGDIRIIDTVDMILQRFCHALHISWSCMRVISHLLLMKLVMSKFDNGFVWSRWSGAEQQQHCVTSTTRMKQRFVIKQRLCIDIEERHSYWNGLQDFSLSIFQVGLINVSHSFGVLSFMSSELCGRFCSLASSIFFPTCLGLVTTLSCHLCPKLHWNSRRTSWNDWCF